MHIYFSGIGGAGLSALAQVVDDLGWQASGSDLVENRNTELLAERGLEIFTDQTGNEIAQAHQQESIDWLVVSSAIPNDHPERAFASENNIKTTKRDGLINHILEEKDLKLIAASGTHGKTTTTAMVVWALQQLEVPVSYVIGTNISFGASGAYQGDSEYFVLEADEFDRHMLAYEPFLSLIPSLDFDHKDTYPTKSDYLRAFEQFIEQSQTTILWSEDSQPFENKFSEKLIVLNSQDGSLETTLAGEHNRRNAQLVARGLAKLGFDIQTLTRALNRFPGTERRFEQLALNVYTDYAHHPAEIQATLQLAQEVKDENQNIVAVYEPHQNVRQHQVKEEYGDCFSNADAVYWLPTYLTRENPDLPTLEPEEITQHLSEATNVIHAEKNQELLDKIKNHLKDGDLIIFMGAGPIDDWLRENLEYLELE